MRNGSYLGQVRPGIQLYGRPNQFWGREPHSHDNGKKPQRGGRERGEAQDFFCHFHDLAYIPIGRGTARGGILLLLEEQKHVKTSHGGKRPPENVRKSNATRIKNFFRGDQTSLARKLENGWNEKVEGQEG